jgi:DNA-binding FadR family transcriptional regulator
LTSVPRASAPMAPFIARTVGSELNLTLYYALDRWLSEQRAVLATAAGSTDATLKAHKAILDAIKGHDSDTAEAAMELRVKQVEAFLLDCEERCRLLAPRI